MLALVLHTLIAAVFGYGISKFFAISTLHFGAAALYAVLAVLYGIELWQAERDSDVIAAGKEEATKDVLEEGEATDYGAAEGAANKGAARKAQSRRALTAVFAQCFTAVFIAEWGDR